MLIFNLINNSFSNYLDIFYMFSYTLCKIILDIFFSSLFYIVKQGILIFSNLLRNDFWKFCIKHFYRLSAYILHILRFINKRLLKPNFRYRIYGGFGKLRPIKILFYLYFFLLIIAIWKRRNMYHFFNTLYNYYFFCFFMILFLFVFLKSLLGGVFISYFLALNLVFIFVYLNLK